MPITTRAIAPWVTSPAEPAGIPRIDETFTVANKFAGTDGGAGLPFLPVGSFVKFWNPLYGDGEFLYLYGVAGTGIGSMVTYNPITGATTLAPSTANLDQPVAIAMVANITPTNLAWYQVSGVATILKNATAVSPNVPVYLSSTVGRVTPTASAGKQVLNARSVNAATAAAGTSTITVLIQRPFAQGQIT